MSIRKTTEHQARQTILTQCRQFIDDTAWDEPGHVWDQRTETLAHELQHLTGADITAAMGDLRELITTLEEIQSVDAGTHPDVEVNASLTIDNRPDILDRLNQTLNDNMAEMLSVAAFRPIREEVAA